MVLPEEKRVTGIKIDVTDHRKVSLECFLEPTREMIVAANFTDTFDILTATTNVLSICEDCFSLKCVHKWSRYYRKSSFEAKKMISLKEVNLH